MGGREAAWRTLWYQPADIRMNNLTQSPIPLLTVIRFDCVCTTGECWGRAGDWVLIMLSFITLPSTCSWWENRLDCNLVTTGFITQMLLIYMDDWLLMYCNVLQNVATDWYRNCMSFIRNMYFWAVVYLTISYKIIFCQWMKCRNFPWLFSNILFCLNRRYSA